MYRKHTVTKVSGEHVPFDENKLRLSLEAAGADPDVIQQIIHLITEKLYEGMPTRLIYQYAFDMLRQLSLGAAPRYKLKRAIMEMGPSGYPFELFVGGLFQYEGFQTKVSIIEQGRCVEHEIDVLAENEKSRYLVECKYHNQQGTKSDVKVSLYVQSRFVDVREKWLEQPDLQGKQLKGWIVTNTRFTDDAIQYGTCAGLGLVGWDYPSKGGSLKQRVEQSGRYPLTCLTSLSQHEKQQLLEKKIVLCSDILNHKDLLIKHLRIPHKRIYKLQEEVSAICGK